jgi:sensor histidine kinase YesM
MNNENLGNLFTKIQLMLWLVLFVIWLLYAFNKWEYFDYIVYNTITGFFLYPIIVYANYYFFLPKFYPNRKRYFFYSFIFLVIIILVRGWIEKTLLLPIHKTFYNFSLPHISLMSLSAFIAYLLGGLLYITQNYIELLIHQEKLKSQQLSTEINLLKAQVQPHFLFNTLNNIYSLAVSKSEKTPEVVAKLSEIMRYFVDDAPKELVKIETEVSFLKNYIELEQIRMHYPIKIMWDFRIENPIQQIPPMLLITFVENVFKHGIDKTDRHNEVQIQLETNKKSLNFRVINRIIYKNEGQWRSLENLKKRLELLYNKNFEMIIGRENNHYEATLKIQFV